MKHRTTHQHSHFWMLLICIVPMGLIVLLPAVGVSIGAFWLLLPLLCAGSHLLMLYGHHHDVHEHEQPIHELHDERRNE